MSSRFQIYSGPCSLESKQQIEQFIDESKARYIRAGLFKMRTNPNSFQGLGFEGIKLISESKAKYHHQFITEVTDPRQISDLLPIVDMFQVGSRNMYNYELLKELNKTQKPILLKRAFSATIDEWIQAAQYLKDCKVQLCERGIRTFETKTRNTLDLNSVIYLKQNTQFDVIVDPSHATGKASMIASICYAALAAGADGLIIESHPRPQEALSDKEQAITPKELVDIIDHLKKMAPLFNKEITF